MKLLKKFNEAYARIIAENIENNSASDVSIATDDNVDDSFITVDIYDVSSDIDKNKVFLAKAVPSEDTSENSAVGNKVSYSIVKPGFNDNTANLTLSGPKNLVRDIVETVIMSAGETPQEFCEDRDPDNECGIWDLFNIPYNDEE